MEGIGARVARLPKPGPIGRSVRLALGLFLLYFAVSALTDYRLGGSPSARDLGVWIGLAYAVYFLPDAINLGLGRTWGRWPLFVATTAVLVAGLIDLVSSGTIVGPAFGLIVFVLIVYAFTHIGLSLIVAAIIAAPG